MMINISYSTSTFYFHFHSIFKKDSVVFNTFDFIDIDNLESTYSDKIFRQQGLKEFYGFLLGK